MVIVDTCLLFILKIVLIIFVMLKAVMTGIKHPFEEPATDVENEL